MPIDQRRGHKTSWAIHPAVGIGDLTERPALYECAAPPTQLYNESLMGGQHWASNYIDGDGIAGIYNRPKVEPIQVDNFERQFVSFIDETSYADCASIPAILAMPSIDVFALYQMECPAMTWVKFIKDAGKDGHPLQ